MFKKTTRSLILFSLLLTGSYAQVFDAIAFIVEGEAVTVGELRAVQAQTGVSKKDAMDLLIQLADTG